MENSTRFTAIEGMLETYKREFDKLKRKDEELAESV